MQKILLLSLTNQFLDFLVFTRPVQIGWKNSVVYVGLKVFFRFFFVVHEWTYCWTNQQWQCIVFI